jgi:hypothetical protein
VGLDPGVGGLRLGCTGQAPPGGVWKLSKDDVTRVSASFKAGAGDGAHRFRARMVRLSDAARSRWSVADVIVVGP